MSKMKYLVFNNTNLNGMHRIFVFPEEILHKDFANKMGSDWQAIRGGFIHQQENGELQAFGESVSCGVQSDPQRDADLLCQQLGGWFKRVELKTA